MQWCICSYARFGTNSYDAGWDRKNLSKLFNQGNGHALHSKTVQIVLFQQMRLCLWGQAIKENPMVSLSNTFISKWQSCEMLWTQMMWFSPRVTPSFVWMFMGPLDAEKAMGRWRYLQAVKSFYDVFGFILWMSKRACEFENLRPGWIRIWKTL